MSETAGGVEVLLAELCRLYGVVPRHRDAGGRLVCPPLESRIAALRTLGARLPPGESPSVSGLDSAVRARRRELVERPLPPVVVAWDGRLPALRLRLPAGRLDERLLLEVELEGGGRRPVPVGEAPGVARAEVEGRRLVVRWLRPGAEGGSPVPPGLHVLRVVGARDRGIPLASVRLLSAPRRGWTEAGGGDGSGVAGEAPPGPVRPAWGVFLPLYALRTREAAGVGDYGALGRLGGWAAARGASRLATLPLFPLFLDEPFDPSPYAPVSRLFWTELYLGLGETARRTGSEAASAYLGSEAFGRRRDGLERGGEVDYRAAAGLRRDLLDRVLEDPGGARALAERVPDFGRFLRERRGAADFASFLAACERRRAPWRSWETSARDAPLRREGLVADRDFDARARDRHLVGQWLAEEQLAEVTRRGSREGFGLYLDLPLSVHPDGYDVWRQRELFAEEMSVGAPPDAFFSEGQDWGFPPQGPRAMRRSGYGYLRASLAHSMRRARTLRLDHVMGLHRLFWIPRGATPAEGVYVRYPAPEQYALLSLASHRHRVEVVGEDLGTVPGTVRAAMARHGIGRLFVVPFELDPDRTPPVPDPPAGSVATLDTHDMWPFAAWWSGSDIEERLELGMLGPAEAEAERARRSRDRGALSRWLAERGLLPRREEDSGEADEVVAACLTALGRGPAGTVVVNLEDLWLETRPQNVPGAPGAARSWRRRASRGLEDLDDVPGVLAALRGLDAARREAEAGRYRNSEEDGSKR